MAIRKPGLTMQAKKRDGFICQCCGRYGDEGHHVHPLCLGGADELNNVITLCGLCHKQAPDNPTGFLEYQRDGGAFTKRHLPAWKGVYTGAAIRAAVENNQPIPSENELNEDFQKSFNETRCKTYGLIASSGLIFNIPEVIKSFEARDKESNDERLLRDKEDAEAMIKYMRQFEQSEYAFNIANNATYFLIAFNQLRERYGLSKATREKIQRAIDFKMQKSPSGYTYSKAGGCEYVNGLIQTTEETAKKLTGKVQYAGRIIKEGNLKKIEKLGVEFASRYRAGFKNQTPTELRQHAVFEWWVTTSTLHCYLDDLRRLRKETIEADLPPRLVNLALDTPLVTMPFLTREQRKERRSHLDDRILKWGFKQAHLQWESEEGSTQKQAAPKQLALSF